MDPTLLERTRMVCPVCRAGGLRAEVGVAGAGGEIRHGVLRCGHAGCRAARPIIDGIPILVEDWVEYASSERWMILRRRDLPAAIGAMLDAPLADDHAEVIRRRHLASYRASHFGPPAPEAAGLSGEFAAFLEGALERFAGRVPGRQTVGLDAGCATGGYTAMLARHLDCAVGIDLHFERVRVAAEECGAAPGAAFLVASAEDPPFEAETFDVVFALNVLDSTALPRRVLESLQRCLRVGGLLVVTTPFDYSTMYSARKDWISEQELMGLLARDFEILEDRARLPWVLPIHGRRSDVFWVRAVAARKRAGG